MLFSTNLLPKINDVSWSLFYGDNKNNDVDVNKQGYNPSKNL